MDKILIVDDMPQNITLMSAYLQGGGFDVISSNTGNGAIKKARLLQPDLILLELMMPDISGYDICRTLKGDPLTKDILILIVTATDSRESRSRAFQIGANDYLSKPFDKDTLMAKVRALIRLKDLNDTLTEQYSAVKEKNDQLEMQLRMARRVQQALITHYDDTINGVHIISKYMPAMDIGGDYYEVCRLNEHTLCVFMADVSGHGISAALLISMIKMMFKNVLHENPRPDKLLCQMNQEFCNIFSNSDIDVYACAFIMYIDTFNKIVIYSNAGHALPIFISGKGDEIREIDAAGVPLGLIGLTEYDYYTEIYDPGDCLLFYTDGLTDSFYKDSPEEFLEMLQNLLAEVKEEPPPIIIERIIEHFYNTNDSAKYENDDVSIIFCNLE